MRMAIFYYDGFAEFETALSCFQLCGKGREIIELALDRRAIKSMEGQTFLPAMSLDEADPASFDLVMLPGGNSRPIYGNPRLKAFVQAALDGGATIAGICGGSEALASMGFLDGRRCTGDTCGVEPGSETAALYAKAILVDEEVVEDGPFLTGQGQAFAEYAVALARRMGVLQNGKAAAEALAWLKNIR